jgi:hypothetical protein
MLLNLQTELNGFANPLHELIQRTSLGMAAMQLGDARDVKTILIAFNDHAELSLSGLLHGQYIAENWRRSKDG